MASSITVFELNLPVPITVSAKRAMIMSIPAMVTRMATSFLYSSLLYTKLFCVLFLGLSCMGNQGVKKHEIT